MFYVNKVESAVFLLRLPLPGVSSVGVVNGGNVLV
jgi:hypothetical protein